MTILSVKGIAISIFNYLNDICAGIYLGGSSANGVIKHPHEIDFILALKADDPLQLIKMRKLAKERLKAYRAKTGLPLLLASEDMPNATPDSIDVIQMRPWKNFKSFGGVRFDDHDYGSYIDRQMILLAGEESLPDYDILEADRESYVRHLKCAVRRASLKLGRLNEKRWYQVCIGTYILENGSYDLTDRQKEDANVLHDMAPETAEEREWLKADLARRVGELE